MPEILASPVEADPVVTAGRSIEDVIRCLEDGEGADRDLDLAILNLWSEHPYRWSSLNDAVSVPLGLAVRDLPSDMPADFARFYMDRDENSVVVVPRYTESQDAGAALVKQLLPGRRRVTVNFEDDVGGFVQVGWRPEGSRIPSWIWTEAHAPCAARAQVAAILKVYAQKPSTRSKEL